jgi:hypothetical protein
MVVISVVAWGAASDLAGWQAIADVPAGNRGPPVDEPGTAERLWDHRKREMRTFNGSR